MHLLLFTDHAESAEKTKNLLRHEAYAVDLLAVREDLADYLESGEYDALLVHQEEAISSFCALLAELRGQGIRLPILAVCLGTSPEDCAALLDAGADDCLFLPYASTELLARLRALLRRSGVYLPQKLTCGDLTLDCTSRILSGNAQQCSLNNKEFQLLLLFMRNPNIILSPELLMQRVWGWDQEAQLPVMWTYICNLRRKLRFLHSRVQLRSVRGAGYLLRLETS